MDVLNRDKRCVALLVDPDAGPCREGGWTSPMRSPYDMDNLTLDHVQEGYGRMAKRAPSDKRHLVTLCRYHHLNSPWATSHRPGLREYLDKVNGIRPNP